MLVVLIQILVFGPTETIRLIYSIISLGNMVEISKLFRGWDPYLWGFGLAPLS